ncbi:alpha/beta hydrolase [Conexibacter woesei]|uniref:alpha/beta hydrolase n=1 Tax=Conexibacter woesei TaxID=191495 RepID=UPI0009DC36C5|nr:alpha/beta hydrolase [Conexibacter woesei]
MTPIPLRFPSGDTTCAALHYPGTNGACVVMAGGTGVTKEVAADRFAPRFQAAGFSVLAIDFRGFGESGGRPRQVVRTSAQVADLHAAIGAARTLLPEVDPERVALWGFSLAGGHVLNVAANDTRLAAAIAQTPLADGPAIAPNAFKYMTPGALLRLHARATKDIINRHLLRRPAALIPLAGPRGSVASLTTPDGARGGAALDPDGRFAATWEQTIAAASALRLGLYRPGRAARRIACPLLVVVCDRDTSVLVDPARRAAAAAPRGELLELAGDHYAPFDSAHEAAVAGELGFLERCLGRPEGCASATSATPTSRSAPSPSALG